MKTLRVLIVNTSEQTGGAAIAANRLMEALNAHGVKAKMLVRDKVTERITVVRLPHSPLEKWRFVWERARVWMHNRLSRKNLWAMDIANTGYDITSLEEFQEANVIHLHWVNQGFLSLKDIERILASGKRIVWTMHDMWPMTAICHHSADCMHFTEHCHDCFLLHHPAAKDLSYKVYEQKQEMMLHGRVTFVGCSEWITDLARKSALLQGQRIVSIPNAIHSSVFHPMPQAEARKLHHLPQEGKLILFGSLKVTDKNKGIDYLVEAIKLLEKAGKAQQIGIVVVGTQTDKVAQLFSLPIHTIPYITDEHRMASLYSAVDAFVTPSLHENLPNVIAEAMSCGVPCVGFHVGGIPEMITHQEDGYVAHYKDADDLAQGIDYVLSDTHHQRLSEQARKAAHRYHEDRVALQYIKEYERPL